MMCTNRNLIHLENVMNTMREAGYKEVPASMALLNERNLKEVSSRSDDVKKVVRDKLADYLTAYRKCAVDCSDEGVLTPAKEVDGRAVYGAILNIYPVDIYEVSNKEKYAIQMSELEKEYKPVFDELIQFLETDVEVGVSKYNEEDVVLLGGDVKGVIKDLVKYNLV